MTMENQPFGDVSPIKNGVFPLSCSFFWGVHVGSSRSGDYLFFFLLGCFPAEIS